MIQYIYTFVLNIFFKILGSFDLPSFPSDVSAAVTQFFRSLSGILRGLCVFLPGGFIIFLISVAVFNFLVRRVLLIYRVVYDLVKNLL